MSSSSSSSPLSSSPIVRVVVGIVLVAVFGFAAYHTRQSEIIWGTGQTRSNDGVMNVVNAATANANTKASYAGSVHPSTAISVPPSLQPTQLLAQPPTAAQGETSQESFVFEKNQHDNDNDNDDNSNATLSNNHSGTSAGFRNRAAPIPRDQWPRLDNLTCVGAPGSRAYPRNFQERAPYFMILGAMKSGTTALSGYLKQHSKVLPTKRKEMHFFDFRFDEYATEQGVLREPARKGYRNVWDHQIDLWKLFEQNDLIVFDDTPRYLFWSDRIPARVMCVTPWVKLIAVLRNPVDRAFSQYNMKETSAEETSAEHNDGENGDNTDDQHTSASSLTFEEWIRRDLQDLRRTGVIQTKVPLKKFFGSEEEDEAWRAYTRLGTHAPLGRGLYAIQLRQWLKAMHDIGKDRNDFMLINSEQMRNNTESVYKHVLKFLRLPREPLRDSSARYVGNYQHHHDNTTMTMHPETREWLQKFFAPYNKVLFKMVGTDWGGAWTQG